MLVKVTSNHIDRGKRCHPVHCPVGLACSESELNEFVVNRGAIYFYREKSKQELRMDKGLLDWVIRFDRKKDVSPFNFELDMTENTAVMK